MGDFFTPPPGYPDVPPSPQTPPPSFTQIGEEFGIGLSGSGVGSGFLSPLFDILVRVFTYIVGFLLNIVLRIFAFIIRLIVGIQDEASLGYGQVVAATFQDLFGVTIDPSAVSTRGNNPNKQAAANAMAQAILSTLFNKPAASAGGGITPSDQNPNRYLQTVMGMELNGWMESWFSDAVSYHLLEKYGDLKDGIARVLGLGRMSRQVFAPPLKVFVHDPYLALLNNTYRPKPMQDTIAIKAFLRGQLTRTDLTMLLGPQGFTEQEIDFLVQDNMKVLSPADFAYLISRDLIDKSNAVKFLQGQGYDADQANILLQIAEDKELQVYRKQAIAVAETAYVDGNMDQASFQNLVSGSGLTEVEQSWITAIANLKRQTKVTHLSRGDIEQGILDGVMSFSDLHTWAQRVNMPADEEAYLELMILFKQNKESATAAAKAKAAAAQAKAQAAAEKAAAAKAQAADKGVTVAQAETLVKDGFWTFDQLEAFLTSRGYGPDAITAIVHLLQTEMAATAAKSSTASTAKAAAAAKGISLAETEKAVVAGILTIQDLQNFLSAHGFDAADAQTIVDLTEQAIAAAQVKAAAKAAAEKKAAEKMISLPEIEHAVRVGLTPVSTYNAALQAAGFDQMSITLLDGILQNQMSLDREHAAKTGGILAAGRAVGISTAQLEQEVIAGIRPISDYTAALANLGYGAVNQQELTQLLQLKVDAAKQTAAKKAEAATVLQTKGVSLPQAENAVKLGVIPISMYQAQLQSAGYTPAAITVLSNSLLAEIAKTKKAQTAATGAATALAKKNISLPEIEQAVIAGLEPITVYTTTLTQNGYSAADAHTLTELLQLKVDHAQELARLHVDADGKATQKGISLASLEASIVAGSATMEQYDTVLQDLGYDSVDRDLLEKLLQAKVTAAAAKAGSSSPPPAGGTSTTG